jgi:predicted transcriptional regulator
MERCRNCLDALRRTSVDNEAARIHLGEAWIDQYRRHQATDLEAALNELLNAIKKEIELRPRQEFWITMQAYVERSVRELESTEPLKEE